MSDLDKLKKLRRQVLETQRESDRAQGALDSVKEELRKKFKCSSLSKAEKLLAKMERQEKSLRKKFTTSYDRFLKEHADKLDGGE